MLQDYLVAHPIDYMQLRARHILIRTPGAAIPVQAGRKELTDEEALAKAQERRKKMAAAPDFACRRRNPTTLHQRKAATWVFSSADRCRLDRRRRLALKPGEISQPVKTSMGYTVIKPRREQTGEELRGAETGAGSKAWRRVNEEIY